jgi:Virulence-associated protein E
MAGEAMKPRFTQEEAKARYNRIPENAWDCAIDIRQAQLWLRNEGDMVGCYNYAGEGPDADEKAAGKYAEDLKPYVIQLRAMGLRPRTTIQTLHNFFRGRINGEHFDGSTMDSAVFNIGLLKKLVKRIYVHSDDMPGTQSFAGKRVPDGMAFKTDARGRPTNTPDNIAIAFVRMGIGLRYDKFTDRYLIDGLKDFGPELDDPAVHRIRFDICTKYGFLPQRQMTFDYCYNLARYNSFDPVCDYFDKVEAAWDGKPRLDRFLIDYAGAKDTPYVRAISELLFLSIVRRNRKPGAKFDEMVVLESTQGKDKSSALSIMALEDKWFTDSFPLNSDNRETLEHAQGKLIVEVAELQGIGKAAVEHVKAMLSRTTDRGRLAYAKTQIESPRRFIFVGTSNSREYLVDQTGNRRFWPVEVQTFDLKKLKRDIDQLWGEAAGRESLGFSIRLDPSLWAAARVEQDKRLAANVDPFADTLRHHLGDKAGRITSEDVWLLLGIDAGRRTPELNRRMGGAMRAIGWKRRTVKTDTGRKAHRVAGYGLGTDARRLVVTKDKNRPAYVSEDVVSDDHATEDDQGHEFG